MAFVCTGIVPNSELLASNQRFRASLDAKGFAVVDDHLRLKGFEHVFVGGDLSNIREEKLAQTAEVHGHTIVANLLHRGEQPIARYRSKVRPILISLGRVDGAFLWGSFWLGGVVPAILKEVVEFKVMAGYRWRFPAVFQSYHSSAANEEELLKKKAEA